MPGFLRGRRYVAVEGAPRFFNFYEARASAPSPIQPISPGSTIHRPGRAASSRISAAPAAPSARSSRASAWAKAASSRPFGSDQRERRRRGSECAGGPWGDDSRAPGIVAVHVLQGAPAGAGPASARKALRGEPDTAEDWVLLIEAVDPAALSAAASETSSAAPLLDAGARPNPVRGVYRLQFGLGRARRTRAERRPRREWPSRDRAIPPSPQPATGPVRRARVKEGVGLRDVAEVAGVSTATVSRAINNPELVSEELRMRVASVVAHLGWVPSGAARALATRRSRSTVGAPRQP